MAAMPSCFATRGELCMIVCASSSIAPPSGSTAPVMILMSVDLPAPFSPISACTSPARSSNEAFLSACTPAYDLSISMARSRALFDMIRVGMCRLGRLCRFVNHNHVQLPRPVNADRQRQFNVGSTRRSSYESDRTAESDVTIRNQLKNLGHRPSNSTGFNNRDMNWWHERRQTMQFALGFKHERSGFRDGPLRSCNTHVAIKQFRLILCLKNNCLGFHPFENFLDKCGIRDRNALCFRVLDDSLNCDRGFVFALRDHAAATNSFQCLAKAFENCAVAIILRRNRFCWRLTGLRMHSVSIETRARR